MTTSPSSSGTGTGATTTPTKKSGALASDHGSSASVDEGAILGRKRSFAAAMGADEGSQARSPAPVPQDFPPGPRGQYYQYSVCPPYLPPTHIPLSAQAFEANRLRNPLPATAQRPEPPQVQANPVTGSQATLDMLTMAATRPPLAITHFYPSEMRTLNQPPEPQHHIYSGTQQPIHTRATGHETTSMDPAHLASTYGGYDGSQILQRVIPQSMSPYSLTQWAHEQPVRGYESEEITGTPFQESPAPARNNVGGSSVWPSTKQAACRHGKVCS
jgi:hypothetical protein